MVTFLRNFEGSIIIVETYFSLEKDVGINIYGYSDIPPRRILADSFSAAMTSLKQNPASLFDSRLDPIAGNVHLPCQQTVQVQ